MVRLGLNRKVSVLPYNILKNELINSLPMKTLKNWPQKLLVIGPNLFFTVQLSPQPRLDFLYYRLVPSLICLLICAISPSQCNPISLTFHEKKTYLGEKHSELAFFTDHSTSEWCITFSIKPKCNVWFYILCHFWSREISRDP